MPDDDQSVLFQQEWSKGGHSLNFNFFEQEQSKNQDSFTWNNFACLQSHHVKKGYLLNIE